MQLMEADAHAGGPQPHEPDALGRYVRSLEGRAQDYANAVALAALQGVPAPPFARYRLSPAAADAITARVVALLP